MQIKSGPIGARERPLVLVPDNEFFAGMAHLQQHFRLLAPAAVLALEEMAEEFLLQLKSVVGTKMRPVLDTVAFQPFLIRGSPHKPFEIAAGVQTLAAPVGGRQEWRLDLAPVRHA